MNETKISDRITFLAESFDVFEMETDENKKLIRISELEADGYTVKPIIANEVNIIALLSTKINKRNRLLKQVSVSFDVFSNMISADPTINKQYLQWMLTTFIRLIKTEKPNDLLSAVRFVTEDLPQANKYLELFEGNKRKHRFKTLCKTSNVLKGITDPSNINQYVSLGQLFDAVDPFIEREPSALERTMKRYVDAGEAIIPVKDRLFTVYIPKTTRASEIFGDFANWCTARKENGMFTSYTNNNKKPNGKKSDIYIIIDNKFFTNESDNLYQIHFETKQIKDRKNQSNVNIYESVILKSESVATFFYNELIEMAKGFKLSIDSNYYLDSLIEFGFGEALFELYGENTVSIKLLNRPIPKLPDLSRFKELDQLIIIGGDLTELNPSIGTINNLKLIAIPNNKLTKLPPELGNLKNLLFLNIKQNPITEISDEISGLDISNGGSLYRVAVDKDDIDEYNYEKLKKLLPNAIIG